MTMSVKARFVSAAILFFAGNLLRSMLPLTRHPLGSYLFFVLLYALVGLALGGGRAEEGETRFWLWAGGCMLLVLLPPLLPFRFLWRISAFLIASHVEIVPALLLGVCLARLLPKHLKS